jgi:co-chaperonin GroES (HSP10)
MLKPLAGHCLVEPESQFREMEATIIIPKVGLKVKAKVGKVLAATPYKDTGGRTQCWLNYRLEWVPVRVANEWGPKEGDRVVFSTSVSFRFEDKEYCRVKFEHVLGVLETDAEVTLADGLVERCRFCKSAGEGNMLLDHKGYCIQCGLNAKREHRDHAPEHKITDEEKYIFGASREEMLLRGMENRPKERPERVISIPGVKA